MLLIFPAAFKLFLSPLLHERNANTKYNLMSSFVICIDFQYTLKLTFLDKRFEYNLF